MAELESLDDDDRTPVQKHNLNLNLLKVRRSRSKIKQSVPNYILLNVEIVIHTLINHSI